MTNEELQQAMSVRGMKQIDMATRLGVTQGHMSYILSGERALTAQLEDRARKVLARIPAITDPL